MPTPQDISSPLSYALRAGAIALMAGGGAVYLGALGWPWVFDINNPDFNPLLLLELLLIGVVVWYGVTSARWLMRYWQFGATRLDLEGSPRLGAPLVGRVISDRPVSATGDYLLVLTCYDVHEFEHDDKRRRRSFPVWSGEVTVSREIDVQEGLPFRFHLPASVGPEPVPSGILPGPGIRTRFTVHVPGMRQVIASNYPPLERYWLLKVSARTRGSDYQAEFPIPLED